MNRASTTPGVRAMLLAAGRGERMRPLTDTTPKPLLSVHGKPLLAWRLEALAQGGFTDVVINTAWLGEQIEATLGQHYTATTAPPESTLAQVAAETTVAAPRVRLHYSHEGRDFGQALETTGGICRALPQLGDIFWVMAGDVYAPDFACLQADVAQFAASDRLAHIWLVPNPAHNPLGDFGLSDAGLALNIAKDAPQTRYTYSTFGLYRKELFLQPWCAIAPGNPQGDRAALAALLRKAMDAQRVGAALYTGRWTDVGTPERLAALNATPLHPA